MRALGRARLDSITQIVAAHSRDRDPPKRAERIRGAAQGWSEFWDGRLDLDDVAWEVTELCGDIALADQRQAAATDHALHCWKQQWPDDVLLSVIGVGPIITKEGPAAMRLAYYQAANVARRRDPQLAFHYRKLMCERGHTHIQANCAVARKLASRTWAVLQTGEPYEPRDLDGHRISKTAAVELAESLTVPNEHRRRNHATNPRRSRHAN